MDLHELFMAMRWAVLALTAAALLLMWCRRAAFQEAPTVWRLLGVGLVLHLLATAVGTADAIRRDAIGGGQVPSYLIALLVIVYALAARPSKKEHHHDQ